MKKIAIISASIRRGRNSHRVALYFENFLKENQLAEPTIIDLKERDYPLFDERLKFIEHPPQSMVQLAQEIESADGVIIVSPEYNGGYPASLKNVIDILYDEWKRKPVAIAMVSEGPFGGSQVITSLQFTLWKIGALTIPAMFPVPTVTKNFSENGQPTDREATDKRAKKFVDELFYWLNAKEKMK